MKKLLLPLVLPVALLAGIIYSCSEAKSQKEKAQAVNAVIGDASYVSKYGHTPAPSANEDERISTHLEYVENLLRSKPVTGLTTEQKERRFKMLDLLHEYRTSGIFPRNYDFMDQRKPCFIDKDGRICAVGYLVEKTAGREAAETINKDFRYAEILEMNSELVDNWIAASGLTKEECAMIQPSYGSVDEANTISKRYGVSSAILGGVNLSASTINGMQIAKGTKLKGVAIVGLLSGVGQTFMGIQNFPETTVDGWGRTIVNDRQKTLSLINIGLGTTTALLSTWNLITNRQPRERRTVWTMSAFEANNQPGMNLTLVRKL